MKKSIIFIILAIYICGIIIVGFFGMKIDFYGQKIPVTKIEFTNNDISVDKDGQFILLPFNHEDYYYPNYFEDGTGAFCYWLLPRVLPNDATDDRLFFSTDRPDHSTVDNMGVIIISRVGAYTITATAKDGSGIKTSLDIIVY